MRALDKMQTVKMITVALDRFKYLSNITVLATSSFYPLQYHEFHQQL